MLIAPSSRTQKRRMLWLGALLIFFRRSRKQPENRVFPIFSVRNVIERTITNIDCQRSIDRLKFCDNSIRNFNPWKEKSLTFWEISQRSFELVGGERVVQIINLYNGV